MFNLVSGLFGAPLQVVSLLGKAVEVVGNVTNNDTVKEVAKFIGDNADDIAK